MGYFEILLQSLLPVVIFFALAWIMSVFLKNASIVDIFWGLGFVLVATMYFLLTDGFGARKILVFALVLIWGLRLSVYIFLRNYKKGEDFRYQDFRNHYGKKRYWWVSFFQVFMLQGVLVWIISAPLLSVMYFSEGTSLGIIDVFVIFIWLVGFIFEAGGDWQMARFKANPQNQGKVLQTGFWKFTRHPNYFGDAAVWWAFALFSVAANSYLPVISSILMTMLLLRVSGVTLLEKTLKTGKPDYQQYIYKTSPFFPWFPKKSSE